MVERCAGVLAKSGSNVLLDLGPLADAAFDISDVSNTALAVLRTGGQAPTRLYQIDLASGRATALGTVGDGAALLGIAIAP